MGNAILLTVEKVSSLKVPVPGNAGDTPRDNVLGETELCEIGREICQLLQTGGRSGRKGKIKHRVWIKEKSKGVHLQCNFSPNHNHNNSLKLLKPGWE